MARKFFNQKVNNDNSNKKVIQIAIIVVCVIGIVIAFFVANYFNSHGKKDKIKIEMRESVAIEINGQLPSKVLFFNELEGIKEDDIKINFDNVQTNLIGEYPVEIEIQGKKYTSKVQVLDTASPTLVLKEVTIDENSSYTVNDFVSSCNDNSNEACNIAFYALGVDQNGNAIDYSSYRTAGTYKIQIMATDNSNNSTLQETTLYINGQVVVPPSTSCNYGNSDYDQSVLLASDVTQNGCALDLNLYQSETVLSGVNNIMDQEFEKLKKEFSKQNINGTLKLNRTASPVLNLTGNGLVGYTIHMDVLIINGESSELVESYDLDLTGRRIYTVNKYNLP